MMVRILSTLAASALAAATVAISTPAAAADLDTSTVAVSLADLNLASAKGIQTLDRRIRQAADRVCGAEPRELTMLRAYETCRSEALASGKRQVAALTRAKVQTAAAD